MMVLQASAALSCQLQLLVLNKRHPWKGKGNVVSIQIRSAGEKDSWYLILFLVKGPGLSKQWHNGGLCMGQDALETSL